MESDPFLNTVSENDSSIIASDEFVVESIILTRYIAYNVIAPVIIGMGILGNVLTIMILNHPTFKGVMYKFYLSLAIFDVLSLFTSISGIFHLINPATSSYGLAVWYSHFEILFVNSFMGSSVLIVVCITFDRYMSVRHPHKFKIIHTKTFCKIGISVSCLISFLIWIPACFLKEPSRVKDCDIFYFKNKTQPDFWVSCQKMDPAKNELYNAYRWIREFLLSFLPIVIVIIFNAFLIKYFIYKNKESNSNVSQVPRCRKAGDKGLSSLLQAIVLCLLITLLPSGIFNAMYFENVTRNLKYEIFRALANNLELMNHALNFYLYVLLSKPVRTALPHLLQNMKKDVIRRVNSNNESSAASNCSNPHLRKFTQRYDEEDLKNENSKNSHQSQMSELGIEKQNKVQPNIETNTGNCTFNSVVGPSTVHSKIEDYVNSSFVK